jgi:Metallo-peptidase family M12B Reprolysin-like
MAAKSSKAAASTEAGTASAFRWKKLAVRQEANAPDVHVYRKGVVCGTEDRGHATPEGRSPLEIVVDASNGFIPLWAADTTLRWRFNEASFNAFQDPAVAKAEIRTLLGEAMLAWGDAAPVRLSERKDLWDFEVILMAGDNCSPNGCVLASAFFPDAGRHQLTIYPKMLTQVRKEQVETLIHELGHAFGLRHFFAQLSEGAWPSAVFGKHRKFSIMNYGADSFLTKADKADLKTLYTQARSGALDKINGTPIRLVRPFSAVNSSPVAMASMAAFASGSGAQGCCCCGKGMAMRGGG